MGLRHLVKVRSRLVPLNSGYLIACRYIDIEGEVLLVLRVALQNPVLVGEVLIMVADQMERLR